MNTYVLSQIARLRIFPILTMDRPDKAEPLADALLESGLACAEVTFRTAAAAESIRIMAGRGDLLMGAGTVLSIEQAKQAADSGARFIVTPGFNPKVVQYCVDQGITIAPGVATPTDIEAALGLGLNVLKFFPAEAFGGIKTLKAFGGPYTQVRFIPTGGITAKNLKDYLALPNVAACAGSWIATPDLIKAGDFETVTQLAKEAVEAARIA